MSPGSSISVQAVASLVQAVASVQAVEHRSRQWSIGPGSRPSAPTVENQSRQWRISLGSDVSDRQCCIRQGCGVQALLCRSKTRVYQSRQKCVNLGSTWFCLAGLWCIGPENGVSVQTRGVSVQAVVYQSWQWCIISPGSVASV